MEKNDHEGIKNRIRLLFQEYGLNVNKASKRLGLSQRTLNGQVNEDKGVSTNTILAILSYFDNINSDWLLTGKGSKLKEQNVVAEGSSNYQYDKVKTEEYFEKLKIYDLNLEIKTASEISYIPFIYALKTDMAVIMSGESMSPEFPAGCYIQVRKIKRWKRFIEFGQPYLILMKDKSHFLRRLHPGKKEEHFHLVSCNPDYEPMEIPISMIDEVYVVIAKYQRYF